jgi:hypothetical protein
MLLRTSLGDASQFMMLPLHIILPMFRSLLLLTSSEESMSVKEVSSPSKTIAVFVLPFVSEDLRSSLLTRSCCTSPSSSTGSFGSNKLVSVCFALLTQLSGVPYFPIVDCDSFHLPVEFQGQ